MLMGSVFRFVKNMFHSDTHDNSLAEYYRIEYQNDPLQRRIETPPIVKQVKGKDRLGNWWHDWL